MNIETLSSFAFHFHSVFRPLRHITHIFSILSFSSIHMYTNIQLKEIYLIFLLLKRKISKENENTAVAIRDRQKREVECEQKKSNAKYFNVQFITFALEVSQL